MPRVIREGPIEILIPDDQFTIGGNMKDPAYLAGISVWEASRRGSMLRDIIDAYTLHYLAPRRLAAARRASGDPSVSPHDFDPLDAALDRGVSLRLREIAADAFWEIGAAWPTMTRRDRERLCARALAVSQRVNARLLALNGGRRPSSAARDIAGAKSSKPQ